jgi:hypothetical protein
MKQEKKSGRKRESREKENLKLAKKQVEREKVFPETRKKKRKMP